jgi:hypothetical protein
MYQLLCEHFDGVTPEQFEGDIAKKNWVLLLTRSERLVGFSTILVYETAVDGSPYSIVYSGDTIVAPEAWNGAALFRTWIESVAKLRRLYPQGPYLWLLLTSGFRTYRFLPLFWREFFPRFNSATPPDWKRLTDHLALDRFGEDYDASAGVVTFKNPQRLRAPLSTIPSGRRRNPHVAFFEACNPRYKEGEELVCLTELSAGNLTAAGHRMAAEIPEW